MDVNRNLTGWRAVILVSCFGIFNDVFLHLELNMEVSKFNFSSL